MPFRDPPPPPPSGPPGLPRLAPGGARTPPSRPPAINPARAAAAAAAAEKDDGPRLAVPRKWRKMRRGDTIFALAALAGCLVAAAIAALVIGIELPPGVLRRSSAPPAPSTAKSHAHESVTMPRVAPAEVTTFAAIGTELEHHRHFPVQGLDGTNPRLQRVKLCAVGDVKIDLRLPDQKVHLLEAGPPSVLECRRDGEQAWKFIAVTKGRDRPCGGAAVEGGMLTSWLDEREPATQSGHEEQWRAREALATTVLAISDTSRPDRQTYVQFCRPLEREAIHVKGFFFNEALRLAESSGGEPLERITVPVNPWPVELWLEGRCAASSSSALPHAGRLDGRGDTPACTLRWTWSGAAAEPFMETTLTLGPGGRLSSRLRLELPLRIASSRVLDPWDSYRRLADVEDLTTERPSLAVLPEPKDFRIKSTRIPQADGASIGEMTQFAEVVERYRAQVPGARRALQPYLQKLSPEETLPISLWEDRFRAFLRETAGFRAWAASAGAPGQTDPVGHADIGAYWSHLKADLASHRGEAAEVALCCMLEELETVPAGKKATKQLLGDLAAGDVSFSGDVAVDFAGIGRSVLVSFGRHRSHAPSADNAADTLQR